MFVETEPERRAVHDHDDRNDLRATRMQDGREISQVPKKAPNGERENQPLTK